MQRSKRGCITSSTNVRVKAVTKNGIRVGGLVLTQYDIQADLTGEDAERSLVNDAARELDGLDIVVNNAGKQIFQESITDISTKHLHEACHDS